MATSSAASVPNRKDGKVFVLFHFEDSSKYGWIAEEELKEALELALNYNWDHAVGYLLASLEQTFNTLHRPTPVLELTLEDESEKELDNFLNKPAPIPITAETILAWAEKKAKKDPKVTLARSFWDGRVEAVTRQNSPKNEIILLLLRMDEGVWNEMTLAKKTSFVLDVFRYGVGHFENKTTKELALGVFNLIRNRSKLFPEKDLNELLKRLGLE